MSQLPELPVSGYALEVDGRLKAEFATKDGAGRSRGAKGAFPCFRSDHDALTKAREEVPLPRA
jgi:hypothetical protein